MVLLLCVRAGPPLQGASALEKEVNARGIPPENQKLLLDGQELSDDIKLVTCLGASRPGLSPGVQRHGWLLILSDQAYAAADAAKGWRDAMNAPIVAT